MFAVFLFMNELKNLTNVVIGTLDKLVHKQKRKYDNSINTNIAEKYEETNNSMYTKNSNAKWVLESISWNC